MCPRVEFCSPVVLRCGFCIKKEIFCSKTLLREFYCLSKHYAYDYGTVYDYDQ
jgi:hypothetical protein